MNTHITLKSFLATFLLLLSFGIDAQTVPSEKEETSPTASDYYLPFRVGNYIKLYGWNRYTKYSYVKTDKINGVTYFLEQGEEWNDQFSGIFQNIWSREDEEGNIVAGAYSTKDDGDINSAVILPTPIKYFPNSLLTVNSYITFKQSEDEILCKLATSTRWLSA